MYWLPRERVLVPTDFSDPSLDAVHTALAMVECGHDVHVLHVVEPVAADLVADLPAEFNQKSSEVARRKHWREHLQSFLTEHELEGLTAVVRTGEPALSITRYAREHDVDLIVMASQGYQRGERISLGSVTERVLHNADCPVLVLRPTGRLRRVRAKVGAQTGKGFAAAEPGAEALKASQPRSSSRPR